MLYMYIILIFDLRHCYYVFTDQAYRNKFGILLYDSGHSSVSDVVV